MLEPGTKLGHYEVVAPVGAGGMGEVYRAHDTRLGRDVAVKVLPEALASDADLLRRFHQEGRTVGALNHPNIMAVYDADIDGVVPYVVTELLEGQTLRSAIDDGSISPRKAIEHTKQIASGLAAAHDKGITHRDLKPDNLFVTEDGRVKILDFGLAKVTRLTSAAASDSAMATQEMDSPGTHPGTILGTVGYMAPEQVRGKVADARSDIFALGAVLYEMLAGRRAFRGESSVETMSAILKEDPPALSQLGQEVAPGVEQVIRHCLEKNPGERFQSARDLAFHLESLSTFSGSTPALAMPAQSSRRGLAWVLGAGIVVAGLIVAALSFRSDAPPPRFQQLTFRRGTIPAARFAADGESIVYSAAWDGLPVEVFITRPESPESRGLELDNADLLDVSATGEIALLLEPEGNRMFGQQGMLARAGLSGSATREILEEVADAGWSPSGDELVVVRFVDLSSRLELPPGTVVHEAPGIFATPRVSPDGERIAFIHHPYPGDDGGLVAVTDLEGNAVSLTEEWSSIHGLAWTTDGQELWFTAASAGAMRALHAVDLNGASRVLYAAPASLLLHDISNDGRVLMTRDVQRQEMVALAPGEPRERDVSWLDWSIPAGLSSDGETLLFTEAGEGGGTDYTVYKRSTDGRTPAVRLSDGLGIGLSADGSVAVVIDRAERGQMRLVPTGAGEARTISTELVRALAAFPRPDADSMILVGLTDEQGFGLFEQPYDGGPVRAVTPPGVIDLGVTHRQGAGSADGDWIVAPGREVPWMLYPAGGGEPSAIDALNKADIPLHVSNDRRFVYIVGSFVPPTDIWRVDITTGDRRVWRRVEPIDPAGVNRLGNILMVAEPDAYVTAYMRTLSDLYLVDGLR